LLDENLDQALRSLLGPQEVMTAAYMGWAGLENGDLLRAAENNRFDVLVTGDQSLRYEQDLSARTLAIVVLSAIQLPILKKSIAKIVAAIDNAHPGSFQTVDCGTFTRKPTSPKD